MHYKKNSQMFACLNDKRGGFLRIVFGLRHSSIVASVKCIAALIPTFTFTFTASENNSPLHHESIRKPLKQRFGRDFQF